MDNCNEILVVDDTPANLQLLVGLLQAEGFIVRPTRVPEMAIESALAKPPDLILLDIKMPGMNGFEVCQKLKQHKQTASVPIIFISALQENQDRARGFEVGGVDFITKPILREEVLARVYDQLELYQIRQNQKETINLHNQKSQQNESRDHINFESLSEAIILLDESVFYYCNSASLSMFGFTSYAEFLSSHLSELSPITQPDGRNSKEVINEMIALTHQKKTHFYEWTYQHASGKEFLVEVLLTRLALNDKDVLQATMRNISKRK